MIDGRYSVVMKTPMGAKKGELNLQTAGEALSGSMVALGRETALQQGRTEGNAFCFEGTLKTAVGKLDYVCDGTVEGDNLTATVKTRKGNFTLTGTRA